MTNLAKKRQVHSLLHQKWVPSERTLLFQACELFGQFGPGESWGNNRSSRSTINTLQKMLTPWPYLHCLGVLYIIPMMFPLNRYLN